MISFGGSIGKMKKKQSAATNSEQKTTDKSAEVEMMDWSSTVRTILIAAHGSVSISELTKVADCITKCAAELIEHDEAEYGTFYATFAALSAHYLSTNISGGR
jgi:hypothetical protein